MLRDGPHLERLSATVRREVRAELNVQLLERPIPFDRRRAAVTDLVPAQIQPDQLA